MQGNVLQCNNQTISSVEVAKMVGMTHKNLLRKIDGFIDTFNGLKIEPVDFFIKSSYEDNKGESRPCYLITKMGCEFLAHKFTGEKGILFTAKYIQRFHEMEDTLKLQRKEKAVLDKIPESLRLARETDWYRTRKDKILQVCNCYGYTKREFMHHILDSINSHYNFDDARKKFISIEGRLPWSNSEVISYFPQLTEVADAVIEDDLTSDFESEVNIYE